MKNKETKLVVILFISMISLNCNNNTKIIKDTSINKISNEINKSIMSELVKIKSENLSDSIIISNLQLTINRNYVEDRIKFLSDIKEFGQNSDFFSLIENFQFNNHKIKYTPYLYFPKKESNYYYSDKESVETYKKFIDIDSYFHTANKNIMYMDNALVYIFCENGKFNAEIKLNHSLNLPPAG